MSFDRHFTYLLLDLAVLAFPLARSFEPRVAYYRQFQYLLPAILLSGAFFIAWDSYFTKIGVWAFNSDYITGIMLGNLPIEEWLFFLVVPFACTFIYECIRYFMPDLTSPAWLYLATWSIAVVLAITALYNFDKWYTAVKLGSTAIFLAIHLAIFGRRHLAHFFLAYSLSLIPFLLMNGALTWLPIVTYNDAENLGIRIAHLTRLPFFNIPIEDAVYAMLMLLQTISVLEYLRRAKRTHTAQMAFIQ